MIYRIKTNGRGYRTLRIKKGEGEVALLLTEKGLDELTKRMIASGQRMMDLMENELRLLMEPKAFERFMTGCVIDGGLIQREAETWIDQNIKEI